MTSKNTWKRIAAGVLAIALVTGAMPTDLGGFLKTNHKSMTASAESVTAITMEKYRPASLTEGRYFSMQSAVFLFCQLVYRMYR